ncbi:MAG: hypothetical protein M3163_05920, partial [Actinomycetota bacterium]|nr:hypothetical protein [Actinomycetota bacterium]
MNTVLTRDRPLGLGVGRPADARVLAAVAVAAVLTDLAVRSNIVGLAGSLLVIAVVAGVLAGGRVRSVEPACVIGPAVPFGVFLSVRMSPWLLPLDILAIAGLLVLGTSLAAGGRLFDLPVPSLVVRGLHAV